MKKHITENQKKINCLFSDLSNLISEFELNRLGKEELLQYFADFMESADVDSAITVTVLEEEYFGKEGKEIARGIKVREGW